MHHRCKLLRWLLGAAPATRPTERGESVIGARSRHTDRLVPRSGRVPRRSLGVHLRYFRRAPSSDAPEHRVPLRRRLRELGFNAAAAPSGRRSSRPFDLVIDIENRPGALAEVATAISDAGVNIAAATCIGPGDQAELHILVPHAEAVEARACDLQSCRKPRARSSGGRGRRPTRRARRSHPPNRQGRHRPRPGLRRHPQPDRLRSARPGRSENGTGLTLTSASPF